MVIVKKVLVKKFLEFFNKFYYQASAPLTKH